MADTTSTPATASSKPLVVSTDDAPATGRRFEPYATIAFVALLLIWQGASYALKIPDYVLPPPTSIAEDIIKHWPLLLKHTTVTLIEVVAGFAVSVAIGIPLAALFTYSATIERAVYPLIVGSNTIPKVALAPLLLAWFGFGLAPKIIVVVLVAFFPIVINSVVGLKSLTPQMIYLARSMGCSELQTFWMFRMPNALPSIFAGLKVATVLSVIGAVVAEFVGSDSGLGYAMMVATADLNIARQFAAILLLSLIGVIFFWFIGLIERMVMPWHSSMRNEVLGI